MDPEILECARICRVFDDAYPDMTNPHRMNDKKREQHWNHLKECYNELSLQQRQTFLEMDLSED